MDLVLSRMAEDAIGEDIYRERFEKALKELLQLENPIAFRSPYSALAKAIEICDLPKGAKIAVSALAPRWHRVAVEHAGYSPQILDVDEVSMHPTVEEIQKSNPSVLILFDALGLPPPAEVLERAGVPIIEDFSQSLGQTLGVRSGNLSAHFLLWSMEADSAIATGGGAILAARGKRDAQILRALAENMVPELAMTDYNATLGFSQLRGYSRLLERRHAMYDRFAAQLSRTRHRSLEPQNGYTTAYAFPVFSETSAKDIVEYAKKYGVQVLPAFASSAAMLETDAEQRYPHARRCALRCLLFPLHHKLTSQNVDQIGKIIATLP